MSSALKHLTADLSTPAFLHLQGSGDPFEMFNNLFGGGMGGMGGAGQGGQRMKANMGGGGGGGMPGGGIEEILMGGVCTLCFLSKHTELKKVIASGAR